MHEGLVLWIRGGNYKDLKLLDSDVYTEALDKSCCFIAGIDEHALLQAADTVVAMNAAGDHGTLPDYVDENVSTIVMKIIQIYTGIVNKMVWRKY